MNSAGKHNLGHPALIFKLCKKVGVPFITQQEKTVPPAKITVKLYQPHKEQLVQEEPPIITKQVQTKEQKSDDETEDDEDNEPAITQGSEQLMGCVNALL